MKKIFLLVVTAVAMFAGCASPYKVTLTNGAVLTSQGKPKLNKANDSYIFKDIQGRTNEIPSFRIRQRSEEHTSELQSPCNLVCRLLLEKKKKNHKHKQQD